MSDLLPYEAYYENSRGEQLALTEQPYLMTDSDLFDAKWSMSVVQRPLGEGVRLLRAKRPCAERTMTVRVLASDAAQLAQRLQHMADVFDADLVSLSPGRLWVNGQYMRCWCSARTKQHSCDFVASAGVTVSIYPETPFWCTEKICSLARPVAADAGGHRYPFRYPYKYGAGETAAVISNTHFAPCPMRVILHGPAENPAVYVNSHRIGINTVLAADEYAVIDQMTRRVYTVAAGGSETDRFDSRTKNGSVFEFAPPGDSTVSVDSTGGAEIILIEQRSEPLWALS